MARSAWIEPHGSGHRARWRVEGKRAPACGPIKATEEEARSWAEANGYSMPSSWPLVDLVVRWRQTLVASGAITSTHGSSAEIKVTRLAQSRGWVYVGDVTLDGISRWMVERQGKNVGRRLGELLAVLRWGHATLGAPVDARVLKYRRPKTARRVIAPVLLTPADVLAIQEAANGKGPHYAALIHYLATYGARPASACKLTVGSIDLANGRMTLAGKRSGQWRHPILPETIALFATICAGRPKSAPLFLGPSGAGWKLDLEGSAGQMTSWYTRNLARFAPPGLRGIYDLKRYAISSMLARGLDPSTVALFTGHLSLAAVLVYSRTNETRAQEALGKLVCTVHTTAHQRIDVSP